MGSREYVVCAICPLEFVEEGLDETLCLLIWRQLYNVQFTSLVSIMIPSNYPLRITINPWELDASSLQPERAAWLQMLFIGRQLNNP